VFCTLNAEEIEPTQTDIVNNTGLISSGIRATAAILLDRRGQNHDVIPLLKIKNRKVSPLLYE
jgi:hypothetical protein